MTSERIAALRHIIENFDPADRLDPDGDEHQMRRGLAMALDDIVEMRAACARAAEEAKILQGLLGDMRELIKKGFMTEAVVTDISRSFIEIMGKQGYIVTKIGGTDGA